jgi:hypothetical protein
MNPHADREYMVFQTRHVEDIKRAEQHNLPYPRRSHSRLVCRALCGLGHKLARWGQYLEARFALPEVMAPEQEQFPPIATVKHG